MKLRKKTNWRPYLETLEARRLLAPVWADFHGDGFADLAVGSPGEKVNGVNSAGAVSVIYGLDDGLADKNNQFFHSPGFADAPEGADNLVWIGASGRRF